jgi:predicted O-methyltransferase YrrM
MTFTEEWFSEASQQVLVNLARVVENIDGLVIEIGSWEGRSTVALANAAHPRCVHCCDTWEGSPGEISAELAKDRDVHAIWRTNVETLTAGNVVEHRMGWREYVPTITQPVALTFIDAEHTYVEVRDTIEAFVPLMVPGGIICGDDAHHEPVRQAVLDVLGIDEVFVDATIWIWQAPPPPLVQQYRELCCTPSDIYLHLPRFAEMVESRNARHVIELGTRTGNSTIAWLYALERTDGRLTSVDLDERPPIGRHDRWTYIQGDDTDPKVIEQLSPADIVFIDTSHHYDHTCRELAIYRHLVKPGGLMVLHDTELRHPIDAPVVPAFPVKRAVAEFCEANGLAWTNYPECFGLAVIEVP